jgi:hypothetical protein
MGQQCSTRWHYTTGQCFLQIVEDGIIKPAITGVPTHEKPIVWFSTNPHWENTASKAMRKPDGSIVTLNMEETAEHCGGLVRFGVAPETAPHDWNALRDISGMSPKMASALYQAAIRQGARPGEWWGCFEPVPRSRWVAVHVYQDGRWVGVPLPDYTEQPEERC